jgi:hypothetical protein
MKKILYTIGDSWTYGYNLENPETECYPYLLSKKLDCDLVNEGLPAASNDWMFRKSIEWIIKNDISKLELFIVGWSFPWRRDENFSFYHGGDPKSERKNYAHGPEGEPISKWISENLFDVRLSYIKTFTYIYTLQEVLKSKKINYLFYHPLDDIFVQDEWYEKNIKSDVHYIYLQIDRDKCVGPDFNGNPVIPRDELRHPNKKETEWLANQLFNFIEKNNGI